MYRIVLIEDEQNVSKKIQSVVNWERLGYSFCGIAPDGEAGLALIETQNPDVILLDIGMPHMDGITMAEQLRKRNNSIKIIVLSGYNDFQTAQKMIDFNIYKYLLKPVRPDVLEDALVALKEQLDQERSRQIARDRISLFSEDRSLKGEEQFFYDLILHDYSGEEVVKKAEQLGINIDAWQYQVIGLIRLAHRKMAGKGSFDVWENMLRDAGNKTHCKCSILQKYDSLLVVILWGEELESILDQIDITCVRQNRENKNQSIYLLRGKNVTQLQDIWQSFQDIQEKMFCFRAMFRPEGESYIDKIDLLSNLRQRLDAWLINESILNNKEFWSDFEEICESVSDDNLLSCAYVLMLDRIVEDLAKSEIDESSSQKAEMVLEHLNKFADKPESIRDYTRKKVEEIISLQKKMDNQYLLVEKAKAYIREHFSDPDLSLKSVAKNIWISPNYLSHIFKKITGESFVHYVTGFRIEKAKQMVVSQQCSVQELAFLVGFNDANYLSTVFRKTTGYTIQDYKVKYNPGRGRVGDHCELLG